jgi:cell division GTPase FtsZ
MKVADRSLDIAVLGLGQAGGNIAAEFHRRGYRALAFNNAKTDLTALGTGRLSLPDAQRFYIGLESGSAAGSDVEESRECIATHAERIRAAVAEQAGSADVVVVAAGLGGGIGSCTPEFIALLRDLNIPIVALTALPHHYESGIAKVDALCAIRDLAQNPPFGWAMIDNAKLAKLRHDLPINAHFEAINRDIVEPLDVFNRLNERESIVPIRAIGTDDLRTLLLGGGILHYHTRELVKVNAVEVFDVVRATLADNPIMPSGSDLASVAYLGVAIEASERMLADCPFSIYEEIAEQVERETGGAAVYMGLYRSSSADEGAANVRVLACAHALPASISDLTAEAQRKVGVIQQKAAQRVAALDLGGLERLRPMRVPHGRRAALDLGGLERLRRVPHFGGATRQSEPKVEPTAEVDPCAVPSEPTPFEPAGKPVRRETSPAQPSRGRYERLANAFRDASADSARARIAGELIAAQQSQDAHERSYAVSAMARVDPAYFRDALRNAARDADRGVSELALRALEELVQVG